MQLTIDFSWLWPLLNSNFLSSLSTIFTIAGAVYIFIRQKRSEIQSIAASIVNEIRNAEKAIQILKEHPATIELPEINVLPQNSWSKYAHLFIKDLDQDQIDSINKFYFDAEKVNYIVSNGNSVNIFLTNIKYRSEAAHNKVLDIIKETQKNQLEEQMKDFLEKFYDIQKSGFHYSPQGFQTTLDASLKNINFILDAPSGIKLKKIAGITKA